jgi:ribonucleoside-diphosphate reductase alpha chain
MKATSHMYRRAWHVGLKTTYYLRTLGASGIEKSTVTARRFATDPATATATAAQAACSIEAMRNGEECEACQ